MAWAAGHAHAGTGDGTMAGMATEEQMAQLRAADGTEAERLFLELMIEHHRGGVAMAEAALDRAVRPEVRRLAQAVVDSQTAEIGVLQDLLAAVGG